MSQLVDRSPPSDSRPWLPGNWKPRLLFYVGVPVLTALLFALNQAGMARLLPKALAFPYWLGLTLPLWALLDLCSRAVAIMLRRFEPRAWLVLLLGSLAAMAIFSPYVIVYVGLFTSLLPAGASYTVNTPFPEAFLDLRRFLTFSGLPIYWIVVSLAFARSFGFPSYLPTARSSSAIPADPVSPPEAQPQAAEQLPPADQRPSVDQRPPVDQTTGFRALVPYHLGQELVALQAEDHYVRVVTDKGNALIRYRFSDALEEVRNLEGVQVHRSHWVALRAIDRLRPEGKGYTLCLHNGSEVPVSRSNLGVLRVAGLR
jgi:hypothetical protein